MGLPGTFLRRNFEPLVLSVQVLIDLAVVLLACKVGYEVREYFAWRNPTNLEDYREVFLLTGAVTLVCFHAFGMYSPLKSLLNIQEFKAIAKSTMMSFLVLHMLLFMLRGAINLPEKGFYAPLIKLHSIVDLGPDPLFFSRLTLVSVFFFIFVLHHGEPLLLVPRHPAPAPARDRQPQRADLRHRVDRPAACRRSSSWCRRSA